MCYFLYIASPLTLSEVRSMLPSGLNADLAPGHRAFLHRLHPSARTVAQLVVGACSCDLVRERRADPIEDERELRARYQRAKVPRTEMIRELERHRRGTTPRPRPPSGWAEALAAFVAEHARNAGPTLYFLDFTRHKAVGASSTSAVARSVAQIRQQPNDWLVEGTPIVVG
jgi:hypothetical protein